MGFLWEGSTGARAVQLLREQPPGSVMLTPDLAKALGAKQTLLHQLLANAVSLRLIKKVRVDGSAFSGWKLGAGNDSANIERRPARPAASPAEAGRRAAAAQRRIERQGERAPTAQPPAPAWPPGFVSTFDPSDGYRPPRIAAEDDADDAAAVEAPVAPWLRGLLPGAPASEPDDAPAPRSAPAPPRAEQLALFDVQEIGEPGRQRRAAAAPPLPDATVPREFATWRQVLLIEAR
jgi:hypothetical protein